jgi:hypothetical protein
MGFATLLRFGVAAAIFTALLTLLLSAYMLLKNRQQIYENFLPYAKNFCEKISTITKHA